MQSFSTLTAQHNQQQNLRDNVNWYFAESSRISKTHCYSNAIAHLALGLTLYLVAPYPLDVSDKVRLDRAQKKFASAVTKVELSTVVANLLQLYDEFIPLLPNTSAETTDNLLKNNISSQARTELALVWNTIGLHFLNVRQTVHAANCLNWASNEAAALEDLNPALVAQYKRDTASAVFELALHHTGSTEEVVSIMLKSLIYLQIPSQYKTFHDCTNTLIIQSTIIQKLANNVVNYFNITGDILGGLYCLNLVDTEYASYHNFNSDISQHCDQAQRTLLEVMQLNNNLTLIAALGKIDLNNASLSPDTKIKITHCLLKTYRDIPLARKTNDHLTKMKALQASFINECETHFHEMLHTKTFASYVAAHKIQSFLVAEYENVVNAERTNAAIFNYRSMLEESALLKVQLATMSTQPCNQEILEVVGEAITITNRMIADVANIISAEADNEPFYNFLRDLTHLLNSYADKMEAAGGDPHLVSNYHDTIATMLSTIPVDKQTPTDQATIFDQWSYSSPVSIDSFSMDDDASSILSPHSFFEDTMPASPTMTDHPYLSRQESLLGWHSLFMEVGGAGRNTNQDDQFAESKPHHLHTNHRRHTT